MLWILFSFFFLTRKTLSIEKQYILLPNFCQLKEKYRIFIRIGDYRLKRNLMTIFDYRFECWNYDSWKNVIWIVARIEHPSKFFAFRLYKS